MYKSPGRVSKRLGMVKTRVVRKSKGQKLRTVERIPLVWSGEPKGEEKSGRRAIEDRRRRGQQEETVGWIATDQTESQQQQQQQTVGTTMAGD